MKPSMGKADRVIRILIAVTIAVLYFKGKISGTVAIVLAIIAGIFLLTSFMGSCPLYSMLNIRTNNKTKS